MAWGPHVSGSSCHVNTLTGSTQSTGPSGPPGQRHRGGGHCATSASAPERLRRPKQRWPPSPGLAGIALRGSGRSGARPIPRPAPWRIQWRWWLGRRRAAVSPAVSVADAGVRPRHGSKYPKRPGGFYGRVRAQRPRARDQMVTGWLPATSACGDALGQVGGGASN